MTDTQWPRWVVFHQEREGRPHEYAGSIHAPDAEIALLNARDVFVRRPDCVSLWVARARDILAVTAEEIAAGRPPAFQEGSGLPDDPDSDSYLVFQKVGAKGVHRETGMVEAASPVEAMRRALATFGHENIWVWWVLPTKAVTGSTPEDVVEMFEIAREKGFRDQGHYHTVAALRKIKQSEKNQS